MAHARPVHVRERRAQLLRDLTCLRLAAAVLDHEPIERDARHVLEREHETRRVEDLMQRADVRVVDLRVVHRRGRGRDASAALHLGPVDGLEHNDLSCSPVECELKLGAERGGVQRFDDLVDISDAFRGRRSLRVGQTAHSIPHRTR